MLGSRGNDELHPGRFFKGDISEIIVFNRTLTEAERATVVQYLDQQWSVPNNNPNCTVLYDCNVTDPYALQAQTLSRFTQLLSGNDTLASTYAYAHASLYPQYLAAFQTRCELLNNGTLKLLPSLASNEVLCHVCSAVY